MRNRCLLMLCAALTVGSAASAGTPLSPAVLGEVDGILSACSKIDSRDEDKFEKIRQSLIPPASVRDRDHDIKHANPQDNRKSMESDPSYRANFLLIQGIFNNMAPDEALKLCKAAV